MKLSTDAKFVFHYLNRHKVLVFANLTALFATSLFEGLGIGMILPILQTVEEKKFDNVFTKYAQYLCSLLRIDMNFLNLMMIFCAIMLAGYCIVFLQQYLTRVLCAHVNYELRVTAFQNLMDLPLNFYYREKVGNIMATLIVSSLHSAGVVELSLQVFAGFVFCMVYMFINSLISLPLTLATFLLSIFSYFMVVPRFKTGFTQGKEEKHITDSISSFILDKLGGIKTLKAFHNESLHVEDFRNLSVDFKKLSVKIQVNRIMASFFLEPFIFVLLVASLIVSVEVFKMPIINLVTFFFIFSRILPKIKSINGSYIQIMEYLPHFNKIQELIRRDNKIYFKNGEKEIETIHSGIKFENVWFQYPGTEDYALTDASFFIEKNKTTALVGASGGGKTTTVDLLMRHHDPERGAIRVDDMDLREIQRKSWQRFLSIVEQDAYLFNDTIYNNIRYGKLNATEEEVIRAARLANAHKFVEDLPGKYQTMVGERGMKLSGGQKQRISMARALIRDPDVLILDEATSALDSESERFIQESIEKFSRSKTIVVIAHRISTTVKADKVVVIEGGRVIEEGSPEELLSQEGAYKKYYSLQLITSS